MICKKKRCFHNRLYILNPIIHGSVCSSMALINQVQAARIFFWETAHLLLCKVVILSTLSIPGVFFFVGKKYSHNSPMSDMILFFHPNSAGRKEEHARKQTPIRPFKFWWWHLIYISYHVGTKIIDPLQLTVFVRPWKDMESSSNPARDFQFCPQRVLSERYMGVSKNRGTPKWMVYNL